MKWFLDRGLTADKINVLELVQLAARVSTLNILKRLVQLGANVNLIDQKALLGIPSCKVTKGQRKWNKISIECWC